MCTYMFLYIVQYFYSSKESKDIRDIAYRSTVTCGSTGRGVVWYVYSTVTEKTAL